MGDRLTTPEAERRTGATRWALLRAAKAGALRAERDNKGRWIWDGDALDAWAAKRPEPENKAEPAPEAPALWVELSDAKERAARAEGEREGLRVALTQAEKRAESAEAETARLREAAERRGRWGWPFR
jgi:hypothetical protein